MRSEKQPNRFDQRSAGDLVCQGPDVFLVKCPRCGRSASVVHVGRNLYYGTARLTCGHCGLSRDRTDRTWQGPVITFGRRRCIDCGRFLSAARRQRMRPPVKQTVLLACGGCGATTSVDLSSLELAAPNPVDPWFGLPLWLQMPCSGKVLWAYNQRHLEFLRRYVTAQLREREPNFNRAIVSRLPKWLKAARNREEILKCIRALRQL